LNPQRESININVNANTIHFGENKGKIEKKNRELNQNDEPY
jgi:hypothetical protein